MRLAEWFKWQRASLASIKSSRRRMEWKIRLEAKIEGFIQKAKQSGAFA
jgi:hypothetical protein